MGHFRANDWEPWEDLPQAEGRRYRIGLLVRRHELRMCDRCMHRRCFESAGRATARTWKARRTTRWRRRLALEREDP